MQCKCKFYGRKVHSNVLKAVYLSDWSLGQEENYKVSRATEDPALIFTHLQTTAYNSHDEHPQTTVGQIRS